MAILHSMIELKGYTPNNIESSIELAKILKKVSLNKLSIEAGVEEICNGIRTRKYKYSGH